MKTEVKPVAENEVELAVEVPRDDVESKIERTITRLSRETTMPGFRKGKVPRQIVLSRLGEDYVLSRDPQRVPARVVRERRRRGRASMPCPRPRSTSATSPAKRPSPSPPRCRCAPSPCSASTPASRSSKTRAEITDAQVDAQLAMLQERFASLKPVEGRPARKGRLRADRLCRHARRRAARRRARRRLHARDRPGQPHPGLRRRTSRAWRPATRADLRRRPSRDDYQAEDLQGKTVTFTVTMKEIKEKVVPPLDDDFAAQASEFDTLDALRDDMRTRLLAARDAGRRARVSQPRHRSGRRQRHRQRCPRP